MVGDLNGDFDDEASIDEDNNTDGGDVSRAGSDAGDAYANGGGGYDQGGFANGGLVSCV